METSSLRKYLKCRNHRWGKVEGDYQYCVKCGLARTVACQHKWEHVNKITTTNKSDGNLENVQYILRCSHCGEMRSYHTNE